MDKILETIMNFINENTTPLIIICVFLIFVLIGYLIDNSIKTKKLEKQMINDTPDYNEEPINNVVPTEEVTTNIEKNKPEIDPNMEINLDFRTPEEIERDNKVSEPEVASILPTEEPEEEKPVSNEITVDPAINDLLLRDFANNGISTIDEKEEQEDLTINPIENIVSIDNGINEETPVVPDLGSPVSVEPVDTKVSEEESVYKNDKKLSDIFKKKTTTEEKSNLENTTNYENELDKILKKLNEGTDSKDSTLSETQDFTNMF